MKTVLVTGNIGAGKSEVCAYYERMGIPVYDCDSRCKELYEKIPGLKRRIETELGIDFDELGRIFSDDCLRLKLEALVYPLLIDDFKCWRSAQEKGTVIIESAIALQKPLFSGLYDEVLFVDAPYGLRLSRNPKAAQRDRIQNGTDCISGAAPSRIIVNDGTLSELYEKLDKLKI